MAQNDVLKRALDAGMAFTHTTRERAEALVGELVKAGEIQLVFTTVDETRTAIADSRHIRQAALAHRVTYYTSMAGCEAAVEGMKHQAYLTVESLQELHGRIATELH